MVNFLAVALSSSKYRTKKFECRRRAALALLTLGIVVSSRAQSPAPAQSVSDGVPALVDVGSHKLQMVRRGSGGPTVVFELGAGGTLSTWKNILPRIAGFTSAVAYTRAGRGASEASPSPRTPAVIVDELRALLRQVGISPPYVLVGRSLGGIYVRHFALMYPTEVGGVVLLDPSHERQNIEWERVTGQAEAFSGNGVRLAELEAAFLKPGQAPTPGKFPDVPLAIITSMKLEGTAADRQFKPAWRKLHDELFSEVSQGMHVLTTVSGHEIQRDEPDLTVDVIRRVVEATRSNRAATATSPTPPAPAVRPH